MARLDLADETFVVADRAEIAARLADPGLWAAWWPDLALTLTCDRGPSGLHWTVAGALHGSAEIWLEPVRDGTVVHFFLRAQPTGGGDERRVERLAARYAVAFKRRVNALKDDLEAGREPGVPRTGRRR